MRARGSRGIWEAFEGLDWCPRCIDHFAISIGFAPRRFGRRSSISGGGAIWSPVGGGAPYGQTTTDGRPSVGVRLHDTV